MATTMLNSIAKSRSEAVFLSPALLGYIGYIENSLILIGITGFVVVGATILHEVLEMMNELDNEGEELGLADIIVYFPSSTAPQLFVTLVVVIFVIAMFLTPLYATWLFYQSPDLYIGVGLFLYLVWIVKLGDWIEKSEDVTGNQQAAIELIEDADSD